MTAPAVCNPRVRCDPMKVAVRLFAGLRELAGTRATEIELSPGSTAADVWPALQLGPEPPGLLLAVNKSYAARDTVLEEGDEIALIPPVSGGAFRLSEEPLSVDEAVREVASDDAGAIATFIGTTRAHSRGRDVGHLEYEAYEGMAEAEMERIAAELTERHDLIAVAIHHRIGVLVGIIAVEPGPDDHDPVLAALEEFLAGRLGQIDHLRLGGGSGTKQCDSEGERAESFHGAADLVCEPDGT